MNRWVLEFHTGQDDAAHAFVQQNYEPDVAQKMLSKLIDPDFGRDICICKSCSPHVVDHKLQPRQGVRLCDYAVDPVKWWAEGEGDDEAILMHQRWQDESNAHHEEPDALGAPVPDSAPHFPVPHPVAVLGLPAYEFAEAVSSLSDSEEMVLALVHPLVQVYTIPRTGQLAYVGHVCNFRQKTAAFMSSLPTVPGDMPFVMVRPRNFKNQKKHGSPFKIDVDKVRRAYVWLNLGATSSNKVDFSKTPEK